MADNAKYQKCPYCKVVSFGYNTKCPSCDTPMEEITKEEFLSRAIPKEKDNDVTSQRRPSPHKDINGEQIYEGDTVKGVGEHVGQSEVFFYYNRWQPFDYLNDFDGNNYEIVKPGERDANDVTSQQQPSTPVATLPCTPGNSVEHNTPINKESLLAIGFEGRFNRQYKRVDGTCWTIYFENGKISLDDFDWISIDITKDITTIGKLTLLFSSLQYTELNSDKNVQECDATESEQSDTDGSQK